MLDRHAWALLRRLTRWLDQYKDCFGHRAQHVSLRQDIDGLLGDSARKSMPAMLARVSEPTSYQAFQHFITHALWDAEVVWRRLRARLPARTGILILDETSFPKPGSHSVGMARQYCGDSARWRIAKSRSPPRCGWKNARGYWARCSIRPRRGRAMRRDGPRPGFPDPSRSRRSGAWP